MFIQLQPPALSEMVWKNTVQTTGTPGFWPAGLVYVGSIPRRMKRCVRLANSACLQTSPDALVANARVGCWTRQRGL